MFSTKQTVEIIDKLIELTQHNQITWRAEDPRPPMIGPDARVDFVYIGRHLGRNIRIYHQQYKYFLDEERFVWDEQVNIDFIDDSGNSLGKFPKTPNSYELLRAVQFQNPSINTFYNDLFK